MAKSIVNLLKEENVFPLRIVGEEGRKYLICPYESTCDNLEVRFLGGDQRVIHFQAVSIDDGFIRHFLYSKVGQEHIFTSSGYSFTGLVKVYSWRAKDFPEEIMNWEIEEIGILGRVKMLHVKGDKENKIGGLDSAIAEHMKRLDGLEVKPLSLEEAMRIYKVMINHVPKY